jgi:hypothetical protein
VVHEAPYWTHGRARRMARTACLTVVVVTGSLAAGIAAGVATATYVHAPAHESWAASHGSSNHQPPSGAVVVGFSVTLLVFAAMRIGYVLHERRSNPDKEYRTKYERGANAPAVPRPPRRSRVGHGRGVRRGPLVATLVRLASHAGYRRSGGTWKPLAARAVANPGLMTVLISRSRSSNGANALFIALSVSHSMSDHP